VPENIKIIHILPSGTRQYNMHGWVAHLNDICVGHIHMLIESEQKIKFLDAWVHGDYRRQGIFRKLWDTRWRYVNENYNGFKAYAWAKPMSLPLLLEKGFKAGDSSVYVEKEVGIEQNPPYGPSCFVSC
jgi:GNAT superfamily N-acetyltransferase